MKTLFIHVTWNDSSIYHLMAFWLFSFLLFNLLFPYQPSTAELITALPGQPANVGFKQHSGYIVTDALNGRALFYYFVEAEAADPLSLPLTLWLNGGYFHHLWAYTSCFLFQLFMCLLIFVGPGCSSVGFGAFMEHGPFQPGPTGQLFKNKHSWNLGSFSCIPVHVCFLLVHDCFWWYM